MTPESTDQSSRPLPIWLSIPTILICLFGGGWIIHWYVMSDPISHDTKILGNPPMQAQWLPAPARRRPEARTAGIQLVDKDKDTWEVRTEKARAVVSVENGKPTVHNVFYFDTSFLPDAAHKTILAANSLFKDQKRTDALKLSIQQVNRLRGLSINLPMAITPTDKEALGNSVAAYVANEKNRAATEPKVLQLLDEISDRSIEATKAEAIDRANKINQIVTPDMWKQNAAMGGGGK